MSADDIRHAPHRADPAHRVGHLLHLHVRLFDGDRHGLLCFCEDRSSNDGSPERPYFMSKNLKKFVKSQKGKGEAAQPIPLRGGRRIALMSMYERHTSHPDIGMPCHLDVCAQLRSRDTALHNGSARQTGASMDIYSQRGGSMGRPVSPSSCAYEADQRLGSGLCGRSINGCVGWRLTWLSSRLAFASQGRMACNAPSARTCR